MPEAWTVYMHARTCSTIGSGFPWLMLSDSITDKHIGGAFPKARRFAQSSNLPSRQQQQKCLIPGDHIAYCNGAISYGLGLLQFLKRPKTFPRASYLTQVPAGKRAPLLMPYPDFVKAAQIWELNLYKQMDKKVAPSYYTPTDPLRCSVLRASPIETNRMLCKSTKIQWDGAPLCLLGRSCIMEMLRISPIHFSGVQGQLSLAEFAIYISKTHSASPPPPISSFCKKCRCWRKKITAVRILGISQWRVWIKTRDVLI